MTDLRQKYPEMTRFIGAHFPDADIEGLSDDEVTTHFRDETVSEMKGLVVQQARDLLGAREFPWQAIGGLANRRFDGASQAREWLKRIADMLEE